MKPTEEQQNVIDHVVGNDGITLVSACAGSGKTKLSIDIVNTVKPAKGLYTAFNKAIVQSAKHKFKENPRMEALTLHALAYRYTSPPKDIQEVTYRDLHKMSYKDKSIVLKGLNDFFASDSEDMYVYFKKYFSDREPLQTECLRIIDTMNSRTMPWSFGFMIKYLHLMIVQNPELIQYDLVILDEINDTTAVSLAIFRAISAPKKVGLGENNQAIYGFMNLVSGFDILHDVPTFNLSKSFRCSKPISEGIEVFLQEYLQDDAKFVGTDTPVDDGSSLYCTLTNSAIIKEIIHCRDTNKDYRLLRDPADIFGASLALASMSAGNEPKARKYKFLVDLYNEFHENNAGYKSFLAYAQVEAHDREIESASNLLLFIQRQKLNIFNLYSYVTKYSQKGSHVISTVFTAKGLEFEKVTMCPAFNQSMLEVVIRLDVEDTQPTAEDIILFRCYYVAASRAGKTLVGADYAST